MVRNPSALRLKWAGIVWGYERLACMGEAFKELRKENPDVEFVGVKR